MNKYDAILICGLSIAIISVFLRIVDMVTEVTLAEAFVVMWLAYRASDRLYKYDSKRWRENQRRQSK